MDDPIMDQLNQVIVLYDLNLVINNEKVNIRKDEMLTLLSKSNEDWWLVKRSHRSRRTRQSSDQDHRDSSDGSSHDEEDDAVDLDVDVDDENEQSRRSSKTFFVPSSYIRELNYVQFFHIPEHSKKFQLSSSSLSRRKKKEMDDDEKRSDEAIGSSRDSLDVISEEFDDDCLDYRVDSNRLNDNDHDDAEQGGNYFSKNCDNNGNHKSNTELDNCDKLEGIYAEPMMVIKARPRRTRRYEPPPLYANIMPAQEVAIPDNVVQENQNHCSDESHSSSSAESSTNSSLTNSPLSSIVDSNFKLKRMMFDGWAEYIDENGRRLYYNTQSHRKAYKPPRRLTATNVTVAPADKSTSQQQQQQLPGTAVSSGTSTRTPLDNIDHSQTSHHSHHHHSQQHSHDHDTDNEIQISESVRKIVEKLDSNLKIKRSPSNLNRSNGHHHTHLSQQLSAPPSSPASLAVNLPLTSQLKNHTFLSHREVDHQSSLSSFPFNENNLHLHHSQRHNWPHLHSNSTNQSDSVASSSFAAPLIRINKLLSNCPPKGWTRHFNSQTKEVYFVNNVNDSKWFCKEDENGRIYFYEENGQGVCSELPAQSNNSNSNGGSLQDGTDVGVFNNNDNVDQTKTMTKSKNTTGTATTTTTTTTVNKNFAAAAANLAEFSQRLITANCPNEIKFGRPLSTNLERNIKAQSIAMLAPRTIMADNHEIVFKEEFKHFSPFENAVIYPPPPTLLDLKYVFYNGTLNRTRTVIAGKVCKRKHWSTSFVVLTQYYLLFFKDQKSAFQQTGAKAEFVLGLLNGRVEWSPNKSSRKNCFLVSTFQDQVLLQDENSDRSAKWFSTISQSITKLPPPFNSTSSSSGGNTNFVNCNIETKGGGGGAGVDVGGGMKLKRSRSTKQYRPNEEYNIKGSNTLSGYATISNTPMTDKKIKIRERLRLFLRKRPTLESLREKGIFKDENIFGCNLELLCLRDKALIPKFVQQCVQAIESKDLKSDGIYRACGNLSSVQKLRFEINQDNYQGLWKEDDVHVLTGLLKMFFRDMKEPLFPCDRFEMLMNTIAIKNKETKLESFRKLINELPTNNYHTLNFVFQHLLRVISYSQENRMHIQNLSIVFGPTLMRPMNDLNNLALDMMLQMQQSQVVEFLLQEYSYIFTQPTELSDLQEPEPFD